MRWEPGFVDRRYDADNYFFAAAHQFRTSCHHTVCYHHSACQHQRDSTGDVNHAAYPACHRDRAGHQRLHRNC